jgi:3-oxoacyl-[acyl-carrier-protein] synthase II
MSAAEPVVTGLGALTPLGLDVASMWSGLVDGRSGIGPITSFDASALPTQIAGEVHGFDVEQLLGTKRARRTARFSQLAVAAAREAVADAGLDVAASPDRVGVVINSAVAGVPETQRAVEALIADGPRAVSAFYVPMTIANMAACEVAIDFGAHGPVSAGVLACASGNYALLEARRLILAGEADVVIAGGADAGICAAMFAGLSNMGPLSRRNDEPERASRPFDAQRDGFVFGEGAAVLVVESAEHAHRRGAQIYGSVAGGALTSDAFHLSAPEPSGTFAARAIELALERTGTRAADVDYVCAHGTGTRANDVTETMALHQALGAEAARVPCATASCRPRSTSSTPTRSATSTTSRCTRARYRCAQRSRTRSGSAGRTASSFCALREPDRPRVDTGRGGRRLPCCARPAPGGRLCAR